MRSFAVLVVSIGVLGIVGSPSARSARAGHMSSWSAPVALSAADPSIDSSLPRVAFDARGDGFAVWQEARANGTSTWAAVKPAGAAGAPRGRSRAAASSVSRSMLAGMPSSPAYACRPPGRLRRLQQHRPRLDRGDARTIGGDCWLHRCRHGGDPAVAIGPGGQAIVAWVAKTDPNHGAGVVMAADVNLAHGQFGGR